MVTRAAHRARWIAVWVFLALWFIALIADLGGGLGNLFLVLAIVVLFYELMAVDRA